MSYERHNIKSVSKDLQKFVINTPVLRFDIIDFLCNCNVFFKCENFQHTAVSYTHLTLPTTDRG